VRRRSRTPLADSGAGMTRDEFLFRFGAVFENRPDLAA
jgi:hypothetical protein